MIKLLLKIKHSLPFIWNIIEYLNGMLVDIIYGTRIRKAIDITLSEIDYKYTIKSLSKTDMPVLATFFNQQPTEAFEYFKPHKFDKDSLSRLNSNGSIHMLGVYDNKEIIGYFFIRFFLNGKAFRGKMVDHRYYGKGISTTLGVATTTITSKSGFRLFETVNKDNIASLKSSQSGSDIKIIKTLDNGYMLIECINEKKTNG